jgi:hypothetical protein
MIRVCLIVTTLLHLVPAHGVPCWAVKKALEQHGEAAVEAWERSKGISEQEIEKGRRCLRRRSHQ